MLISRLKRVAVHARRNIADRLGSNAQLEDDLVPPDWMFADPDRVDGSHSAQEFISIGDETTAWLIEYEGLASSHHVLDVGCGLGRMARPLTRHLTPAGSYD